MSDTRIDLNELASRTSHQLTLVPPEDSADRTARIEIAKADAAHKRRIELILYIAALVLMSVALGLCVWVVVKADSSAEDKNRAITLLAAIVTGFVGYVTGRATK